MGDLKFIAVLAGIWLILRFLPADTWTRLVVLVLGRRGLERVGKAALAKQPDRITVMPLQGGPTRPEAVSALEQLARRGFTPAGGFAVHEMGDLPVHFMVKPEERSVAAVYEHPQAGVWCDIVSRYLDGRTWMITNARLGGALEARPGHVRIRAPGLTPSALHLRFVQERPGGDFVAVSSAGVSRFFAEAYAEETAWRKGRGLSADEVKNAGLEPFRESA